jgi:hypothetical protein
VEQTTQLLPAEKCLIAAGMFACRLEPQGEGHLLVALDSHGPQKTSDDLSGTVIAFLHSQGRLHAPSRTGLVSETQLMRQEEPGLGGPLGPIELRKLVPFEPHAASDLLGWAGLQAARYREAPTSEIDLSPLTHHTLVLITKPPEELDLLYDGVKRHMPPPAGSIAVVSAGSPALWRWSGHKDSLHI